MSAGSTTLDVTTMRSRGTSKAINAAKMALWGDGTHRVSLDEVIVTMREKLDVTSIAITHDMASAFKIAPATEASSRTGARFQTCSMIAGIQLTSLNSCMA